MQAMNLGQKFMEWIEEQNVIKNYPDFEGCQVKKIENLQNMPKPCNGRLGEQSSSIPDTMQGFIF